MDDIAYVSCDESAYSGNLGVQGTIHKIISNQATAGAMVLYSTEYDYCKYVAPISRDTYTRVFSVMNSTTARDILEGLDSADSTDSGTSSIASNVSEKSGRAAESLTGPGINDGAYGGGGTRPSSSIAMIILYSVTGIITFLFLTVIIVGTVRAHRHPERYGPQNVAGRPRQSRARGIARAMLETLPIVKFGDSDDARNEPKQDIEMASSQDGEHEDRTGTGVRHDDAANEPGQDQTGGVVTRTQSAASPPQEHAEVPRRSVEVEEGQIGPALLSRPGTPSPDESVAQGTLGCPICTDDFVKGQDVRLLPCDHKFHPECIDPWLVNVSGTCPLW